MLGWYIAKAAVQIGLTACLVAEEEFVRRANNSDFKEGLVKSEFELWARGTIQGVLTGLAICSGVVATADLINVGRHV